MRRLLYTVLFLCALGVAPKAGAQYYTWGSDPAGLKWSTIRTPDVRMIYPDTVSGVARRTLFYIRTVFHAVVQTARGARIPPCGAV